MPAQLTVSVEDRLRPVSPADWGRLFPSHPDSPQLLDLIESAGMDGFAFASIVVRDGQRPVLLLPLFETRLNIAGLLDGPLSRVARIAARFAPSLLNPRVTGVGFVEGEWGAIGIEPSADAATLREAWALALDALDAHARQRRSHLRLWLNLTPAAAAVLPEACLAPQTQVSTYPCGRLALPMASFDQYLASLSKNARHDLRRKLRDASSVTIQHADHPGEHLEAIHSLYRGTVERANLSLGIHRPAFFERVGREVPGAHFGFYFVQGTLAAFNLLVQNAGALVDKYFCADPIIGPAHNLYFVSWAQNVRYCIENRIPVYHAGPGAEATKARLGARFIPSVTLFRHRNPIANALFRRFRGSMAYVPQVDLADPSLLADQGIATSPAPHAGGEAA